LKTNSKHVLQVPETHYRTRSYNTKGRFVSYWHQVDEILSRNPKKILEIGVGNGLVSSFLKSIADLKVTTLDIDPKLRPDKVGSVLAIPFRQGTFDLVACYEVLEHLPFDQFIPALTEMRRVTRQSVVISLPNCSRVYKYFIHVPKIGDFQFLIPRPEFKRPVHTFDGEHYWEISKQGYDVGTIRKAIDEAGFALVKEFRAFELPTHHFFVLSKR
jgi:ubiquinone/menaquinone biosynthesis C-methylase UbiE